MAKDQTRKPEPPTQTSPNPARVSANQVLNDFLKEKKIVLGLNNFKVSYTNTGTMVVDKPNIIAVYDDEVEKTGGQLPN